MSTAEPRQDLRTVRGRTTRAQLLAAAADLLREQGYAGTSMRAVADRAGARLSLVQYHFGSKHGLLVAVLEDLTERLLERQRALFDDDRPFADQWRTACEYLREDIRSGYVRILWELWGAGLADPEIAERWRATQRAWRELIEARLERLQTEGGVELPMPPRALATLIGNLFEGAETEILAGVTEGEAPHLEALDACAALIARAERR
ncbi:MAG TPA: TetR family transcriptional regulator [Conexibacter sp.]|nr:TetR family transcriptional regulator [Conexibacter sp.]